MINLVGQRFGRLVALEPLAKRQGNKIIWLCLCVCGNKCKVATSNLRRGHTKSCGCLLKETAKKRATKHGHKCDGKTMSEYESWQHIKGRCLNPTNNAYKNYGARGIAVCDRWLNSFENFLADMGEKLSPVLSIDRIDNDGNYEPGNCRWATPLEQAANTRKLKWFYAYNKETGEFYKINNQHEFARGHNLRVQSISDTLRGKQKTYSGWRFLYA